MPESTAKPRIYASAFFCQEVLRERENNLLTVIRISDKFTLQPAQVPVGSITKTVYPAATVHAVLRFQSDSPTDFEVHLKGIDPDGLEMKPMPPFRCESKGGAAGHSLNLTLTIATGKEGDYRLEVYVDGSFATATFFRIKLDTLSPQPNHPSAPPVAASE